MRSGRPPDSEVGFESRRLDEPEHPIVAQPPTLGQPPPCVNCAVASSRLRSRPAPRVCALWAWHLVYRPLHP